MLDLHPVPERHMVLDLAGQRTWMWVVLGRLAVHDAVNLDVVVPRDSFPDAQRARTAIAKELTTQRLGRKVVVTLRQACQGS